MGGDRLAQGPARQGTVGDDAAAVFDRLGQVGDLPRLADRLALGQALAQAGELAAAPDAALQDRFQEHGIGLHGGLPEQSARS